MADLAGHDLIGYDAETPALRATTERLATLHRQSFALRSDSNLAQLAAIRAGFGIGLCQVAIAGRDPTMVRVVAEVTLSLPLWIVMHENLKTGARYRMVFESRQAAFHPLSDSAPHAYQTAMRDIHNIVILTGAGMSAESGIPTFRSRSGISYWDSGEDELVPKYHRVEDVCTPEALAADPDLVHRFYDLRRAALAEAEPNAAHRALAQLDAAWQGELLIVTQNVDDLHERAGATRMLHMHGELLSASCAVCGAREAWTEALPTASVCGACGSTALRPDIVFFGEMPYQMERIEAALAKADLFVSVGTSGAVYPAAGFVQTAAYHGAATLELNLDPSMGSVFFEETRIGPAGVLVPAWVEELLSRNLI